MVKGGHGGHRKAGNQAEMEEPRGRENGHGRLGMQPPRGENGHGRPGMETRGRQNGHGRPGMEPRGRENEHGRPGMEPRGRQNGHGRPRMEPRGRQNGHGKPGVEPRGREGRRHTLGGLYGYEVNGHAGRGVRHQDRDPILTAKYRPKTCEIKIQDVRLVAKKGPQVT